MKKIYFLHGYQTSGKKFKCIKEFYKNSTEFLPVNWDWNENMNIPEFLEERKKILEEDQGEHILIADSMGANLAWNLVNEFPDLQYIMTNPVFSVEQIREQERILPEMRPKIFTASPDTVRNRNVRLVISRYDQTLDPEYYKRVFGTAVMVKEIPDEHAIVHMSEYMPVIHELVKDAFEKTKNTAIL